MTRGMPSSRAFSCTGEGCLRHAAPRRPRRLSVDGDEVVAFGGDLLKRRDGESPASP